MATRQRRSTAPRAAATATQRRSARASAAAEARKTTRRRTTEATAPAGARKATRRTSETRTPRTVAAQATRERVETAQATTSRPGESRMRTAQRLAEAEIAEAREAARESRAVVQEAHAARVAGGVPAPKPPEPGAEEGGAQWVGVRLPLIPVTVPVPHRVLQQAGWMAQTARANLPPTDRIVYYAGLGAMAALGAIEWPVAAVVGAGVWVASRTRMAGGQAQRSAEAPTGVAGPVGASGQRATSS